MVTARIGEAFARPVDGLVRAFARFSPHVLTIPGLVLTGLACAFFAFSGGKGWSSPHLLQVGAVVALAAAIFDMLDGRVARLRGRETKFGAFLDSTMDRYSDMVLYMGLMILYARLDKTPHMVLVWVAAFGSFMTSSPHPRRAHEPDGGRAVDHRRPLERDRRPARGLHLRRAQEGMGAHRRGRSA